MSQHGRMLQFICHGSHGLCSLFQMLSLLDKYWWMAKHVEKTALIHLLFKKNIYLFYLQSVVYVYFSWIFFSLESDLGNSEWCILAGSEQGTLLLAVTLLWRHWSFLREKYPLASLPCAPSATQLGKGDIIDHNTEKWPLSHPCSRVENQWEY